VGAWMEWCVGDIERERQRSERASLDEPFFLRVYRWVIKPCSEWEICIGVTVPVEACKSGPR
jgi:hypothetical protein